MSTEHDMKAQIDAAINNSLPSAVGAVLKHRLEKADRDASTVDLLTKRVTELTAVIEKHSQISDREKELSCREADLAKAQKDVDAKLVRAELNDLKVQLADKRAQDCKEIVALVFQNSKLKYFESSTVPMLVPPAYQGGMSTIMQANGSKGGEVES